MIKYIIILCLIVFLLVIINKCSVKIKEGLDDNNKTSEYQEYGQNSVILAEKNAANIEYIKEQLDKFRTIEEEIFKMKTEVKENTFNIQQIAEVAEKEANNLVGNTDDSDLKNINYDDYINN